MKSTPLEACVAALEDALTSRLRAGVYGERDYFAPLGEWLWWQGIIDTLQKVESGTYVTERDERRPEIRGLRHARNVVGHGSDPTERSAPEDAAIRGPTR